MASPVSKKARLVESLSNEIRRMGAQSVLISSTIADKVGLTSSDLECLDLIVMDGGGATPGRLASATGLTTGAITGLIDRLEKAGFVRRQPDPADRRKVFLVASEDAVREIGRYYAHLETTMTQLWEKFTVEQLQTVLDFASRSADASTAEIEYLRALPNLKRPK
jgi:DNA-binding MarR family transcriptional regulator